MVLLLSIGCNARQGVEVAPQQALELGQKVKVYQASELAGLKYTSLGAVDASACKWMLWDRPPTAQAVTNQVLYKADQMSANGITGLSCESDASAALLKDCWAATTCKAQAIQVQNGEAARPR